jgi:hypothetical protein
MVDFAELWGEQGEDSFEPLPVGNYTVEVIESDATVASTSKPMIKATCKVVGGPYDNRRLWHNFVVSEDNKNALAIFFRNMTAFGLGREYMLTRPTEAQVAQALLGRRALANVGIRKYQGEDRNEVKKFTPAPNGSVPSAPVAAAAAAPTPAPAPAPPPASAAPQATAPAPAPAPQAPAPAPEAPPF